MNVDKAMKTRPAREPLDTLEACIRDFQWRRAPGGGMDVFADDIPAMCAEAKDFDAAVWIAVACKRRNGKMHSHQTKVKKDARREFGYRIIERYNNNGVVHTPHTFDALYDEMWDLRPAGIGPLTNYDVATRLGGYLELAPDQIYLHTGARMGWDAMWNGAWHYRPRNQYRIPLRSWPLPLRYLSADMAEDFLCTYRSALEKIKRDAHGVPL